MKRYAILLAALPVLLLTACVPYYVDYSGTYESGPAVVEAPILPPEVILESRPYYVFRGYYYYWDNDRDFWLYSRSNRGPWYQLPRTHYPERFQYRGQWHEGRGRGGGDRDRGWERGR